MPLIVQNLIPQIQSLWGPLLTVGQLMGLCIVAFSLVAMAGHHGSRGGNGEGGWSKGLVGSIAGAILFQILSFVDLLSNSMLSVASQTGLTYTAPNATDPSGLYVTFAVYVVMIVGLFGSIYGCVLLKRSAEDGKQLGPAMTHLIGGMLAINIVQFLSMLGNSMGSAVSSVVSSILGQ